MIILTEDFSKALSVKLTLKNQFKTYLAVRQKPHQKSILIYVCALSKKKKWKNLSEENYKMFSKDPDLDLDT